MRPWPRLAHSEQRCPRLIKQSPCFLYGYLELCCGFFKGMGGIQNILPLKNTLRIMECISPRFDAKIELEHGRSFAAQVTVNFLRSPKIECTLFLVVWIICR